MNTGFLFRGISLLAVVTMALHACAQPVNDYTGESQAEKDARMAWWSEARFGMFIHWGLYSIPAGEWKGENHHGEWIRTTAQIPLETYDGFVQQFNPVGFDATEWVRMAKKAGMKYIVITSKHHDGFCLFDSEHTDFDVMSTPFRMDILKELSDACHREGLRMCWYHSIMDWHHPDYLPRRDWETGRTSEGADFTRYIAYMKSQLRELVTNYGDIGVLWFDGEWEETWNHDYGVDLYNHVRSLQPSIIINNRVDKGRGGMAGLTREGGYVGDFGTPEQEIPATGLSGIDWETCMTMNDHWGYNSHDTNWKSTSDLIRKLADIASKGGNFLLNVGPRADGTFPEASIQQLAGIGAWMKLNGESVYGTQAGPIGGLAWGRCTQKSMDGNTRLYLHVFDWPADGHLIIPGIFNEPLKAFLLSDELQTTLKTERVEDALVIRVPDAARDTVNTVVVLDVKGKADVSRPPEIHPGLRIFVNKLGVTFSTERQEIEIRFTLDGTEPGPQSDLFAGAPVMLSETTTVTARCFRDGKPVSGSLTATFEKVEPMPSRRPFYSGNGLICRYYEGDWDSLPDFRNLTPLKTVVVDNFGIEERVREEHYGLTFDGYIEVPSTGVFRFYTESDDGSRLWIDDLPVVDNDGLHGMELAEGAVPLAAGLHGIRVEFFEKDGSDNLKVFWQVPGFKAETVPGRVLFQNMQ